MRETSAMTSLVPRSASSTAVETLFHPSQPLRRLVGKSSRSSKKSVLLYSDYYEDEGGVPNGPQRSASLTTLSGPALALSPTPSAPPAPVLEPRMAQLETLEAKMASIEVSLSTTPRRKKAGSLGSVAVISSAVGSVNVTPAGTGTGVALSAVRSSPQRDLGREIDALRTALRDKENVILSLQGQICGRAPSLSSLSTGPPPAAVVVAATQAPMSDKERRSAEERLTKLRSDGDSKKLAIKKLKMSLERLDITDNIDVRIQQAELEYQLGREELSLLSLQEEIRNLSTRLEDDQIARNSAASSTLYSCLNEGRGLIQTVSLTYDPKSPRFGAGPRDDALGLYVDWTAMNGTLEKGDRIVEVNGKLVLTKTKEDMLRLLAVSPDPAQIVVLRPAPPTPPAPSPVLQSRDHAVEDALRSDNVRLTHRISYLEDQVAELLERVREDKAPKAPSTTGAVTTVTVAAPIQNSPSSGEVHVFQKGPQVTTLLTNLPGLEAGNKQSSDRGTIPTLRTRRSTGRTEIINGQPVSLTDMNPTSDGTSRTDIGNVKTEAATTSISVNHDHVNHDHSRHGKRSSYLQLTRSTNALDAYGSEPSYIRIRHHPSRSRKSAVDIHRDHMEKRFQHIQDARNSLLDYASEATSTGDLTPRTTPSVTPTPDSVQRHYRKHHEYNSCGEGRPHTHRPAPPRKPLRLSLHRASSLQSIESGPLPLQLQVPAADSGNESKKPTKRNHKGLAPTTPGSEAGSSNSYQSAIRWPSPPNSLQQLHCRRSNLNAGEKWC